MIVRSIDKPRIEDVATNAPHVNIQPTNHGNTNTRQLILIASFFVIASFSVSIPE
jgi:hypothetical protein